MADPIVCCIMLTKDRPQLAAKAVECFRAQTYPKTIFFGLDTGEKCTRDTPYGEERATTVWMPEQSNRTIGKLRNAAIRAALGWRSFDIVAHLDDDDYSAPTRIAEQVALLQSSGKECVGYRDMLFWRSGGSYKAGGSRYSFDFDVSNPRTGEPWPQKEAWLYHNDDKRYCVGTSLCYTRRFWEDRPFADLPQPGRAHSEDWEFLKDRDTLGVSSISLDMQPRMIARIHGGNTQDYSEAMLTGHPHSWKRVQEWDERVRGIMEGQWTRQGISNECLVVHPE